MCDMPLRNVTHSNTRHDPDSTWLIPQLDVTRLCVWHYAFLCVVWLQLSHWSAWRDAFPYEMPPMTPSCLRHDSFLYETWLIPIWDLTHLYMHRDIFLYATCPMTVHTYRYTQWRAMSWIEIVSYSNANNSVNFCGRSHVLHGSFAKKALPYMAFLKKEPPVLLSTCEVVTCEWFRCDTVVKRALSYLALLRDEPPILQRICDVATCG